MHIINFYIESMNKFENLREKAETPKTDLNNSGLSSRLYGLTHRTPNLIA